jgi:hypothetical protein
MTTTAYAPIDWVNLTGDLKIFNNSEHQNNLMLIQKNLYADCTDLIAKILRVDTVIIKGLTHNEIKRRCQNNSNKNLVALYDIVVKAAYTVLSYDDINALYQEYRTINAIYTRIPTGSEIMAKLATMEFLIQPV